MTTSDYLDWWRVSGIELGATILGGLFKQPHQDLSQAGVNVVVLSAFLRQRPDANVNDDWPESMISSGSNILLKRTIEALEAIGARRVVDAFHEGKRLRTGAFGFGLTSMDALVTSKTESWDQISHMLDDYARLHHYDLTNDVAKHGDPRQRPDFDRRRITEEQARRTARLAFFREQEADLPGLLDKLQRLKSRLETDPPDSVRVQKERQKLMKEFERYAHADSDALAPDLRTWLQEIRRLRDDRPDVFEPLPTRDASVNARLRAIGEFDLDYLGNVPIISWSHPADLTCDWTRIGLFFYTTFPEKRPDPAHVAEAFNQLIDAWEQLRPRFPTLEPQIKQAILDDFRTYRADQLWPEERADYEDDRGQITDEKILAKVDGGAVALIHHGHSPMERTIGFDVGWDEEHGLEIGFDADDKIIHL